MNISWICNVLWIHIQRLEYGFFRDTPLEDSIREHERMIRALEMKDEYSASVLVKEHWDRSALLIQRLYKK